MSTSACAVCKPSGGSGPLPAAEQVQGTDHVAAQFHRQGVHRREPGVGRRDGERRRHVSSRGLEPGVAHPGAGAECVEAGAFVVLQLE